MEKKRVVIALGGNAIQQGKDATAEAQIGSRGNGGISRCTHRGRSRGHHHARERSASGKPDVATSRIRQSGHTGDAA